MVSKYSVYGQTDTVGGQSWREQWFVVRISPPKVDSRRTPVDSIWVAVGTATARVHSSRQLQGQLCRTGRLDRRLHVETRQAASAEWKRHHSHRPRRIQRSRKLADILRTVAVAYMEAKFRSIPPRRPWFPANTTDKVSRYLPTNNEINWNIR